MTDRPEDAGHGALFKNDKKEKPSHPDYKGDVTIHGKKFWISAWLKPSEKTGKKYMSLAFRRAEEEQDTAPAKSTPKRTGSAGGRGFDKSVDDDQTIPF